MNRCPVTEAGQPEPQSAPETISVPAELLKTIANARPQLPTLVEHILHLPELCPATQNPAPGSTLTVSYQAGEWLLELFSLDTYIDAFFAHPVVRDMELFVQTVAQDAANAARVQVTVLADVRLNRVRQGQRITVVAQPEA